MAVYSPFRRFDEGYVRRSLQRDVWPFALPAKSDRPPGGFPQPSRAGWLARRQDLKDPQPLPLCWLNIRSQPSPARAADGNHR